MTLSLNEIVKKCQELYDDLSLASVRRWKDEAPGRKAIAFMPVYAPRELIHAAGMLPVGLMGGGENLEIIRGDSYFQSYICHIPRSTIELGLSGKYDLLDGFVFPSTCDVIRNLSGMWKILFPTKYVKYFDVPQNFDPTTATPYYVSELGSLVSDLQEMSGQGEIPVSKINASIEAYNANRKAIAALYRLRVERPWLAPASESYLLMRAANVMEVREHTALLNDYLAQAESSKRNPLDNSRVVVRGLFCEQPPLNLIRTLERSGCYIVEDDFVLVSRWIEGDVAIGPRPLENLAKAYLERSVDTACRYDSTLSKADRLAETVKRSRADGVIFCAPSFCDPALLDQPMLMAACEKEKIPYTHFKYAENTGQFQVIREQAGTFSDSVKLWGDA